ncbi:MAG: aminotransferase class III-fold pyridoxal phosphate-dependent enzyme [Candidatus Eremiobacteraeota bacterium]|nr:aminotransferase class III-fold pyridoxal phosphate-dependent enzyme [Candidatus Eremiobacteraeota bacterium]
MAHLWLPFTQMRSFRPQTRTFVRGSGTMLEDARGTRVYDAVSSIWTILHGHCHPRIVEAIARQAATLDHATLLGASNPAAATLAERLCALTDMDRAFFCSDGASAIEAAIKMAAQYWQNLGRPQRRRFVRMANAYHGDTIGAMSVSDIGLFKSRFGELTFETRALRDGAALGPDVAAVIVEPLVQAAAGMQLVDRTAYDALRDIEPLLIVDEIATGFGRTGTMFAYEQTALRPDVLCLGKSITGGALALSCALVRRRVYDAFLGDDGARVHFFHGHSYAGNPVACAAALASLDLFDEETTLERAAGIARRAGARLQNLRHHPLVLEARQCGAMIGIELRGDAWRVADRLYEAGHFTRPIGEVLQFVPPLCSTDIEIDAFFDALSGALAS